MGSQESAEPPQESAEPPQESAEPPRAEGEEERGRPSLEERHRDGEQHPPSPPAAPDFVVLHTGPQCWFPDEGGPPLTGGHLDGSDPFLRVCKERRDGFAGERLYVVARNSAEFPLFVSPLIRGGFVRGGECELDSFIMDPGEEKLLAFICIGDRSNPHYNPDQLPHLACSQASKRDLPLHLIVRVQPALKDHVSWRTMAPKDGLVDPEVWQAWISGRSIREPGVGGLSKQVGLSLRVEQLQSCTFSDSRRPMPHVRLKLHDIRHCQDSCGDHFRNGAPLADTVKELAEELTTLDELGIRVVDLGGVYFALDNRRLRCAKLAFPVRTHPDTEVPVQLASLSNPDIQKEWAKKFTVGRSIPLRAEGNARGHPEPSRHRAPRAQHPEGGSGKGGHFAGGSGGSAAAADQPLACAECGREKAQSGYSARQLKKKAARRCRDCVGP